CLAHADTPVQSRGTEGLTPSPVKKPAGDGASTYYSPALVSAGRGLTRPPPSSRPARPSAFRPSVSPEKRLRLKPSFRRSLRSMTISSGTERSSERSRDVRFLPSTSFTTTCRSQRDCTPSYIAVKRYSLPYSEKSKAPSGTIMSDHSFLPSASG